MRISNSYTVLRVIDEGDVKRFASAGGSTGLNEDDVLGMIQWHDSYKNLYPGYSEYENEYENEYMYDSEESARQVAREALDVFDSLSDPVKVYRTVTLKNEFDFDTGYPGESWSYDYRSALSFGSHNASNYIVTAEVPKSAVDWKRTLSTYMEFSSGNYTEDAENELVVDNSKSSAIKNINIIKIKDFKNNPNRFASANAGDEVPPAPGTTSIPADYVRLYHYISSQKGGQTRESQEQMAENLKRGGIDISKARGSTYGEPNMVWASTKPPGRQHVFAEFDIHKDDPRWNIGRPRTPDAVDWLNNGNIDVTFRDSIKPEEIIAVHLPWHGTYRYLEEHNMFPEVLNGDYDHLLDNPEGDEAKAINYIKSHHGHI